MNTTARPLRIASAAVLSILALSATSLPTAAWAKDGDVVKRGSCSASSDWKVKASPEDGRIEVEGEVDSNVNGQTWKWKLFHNGARTASGTRTTTAPSGSFEVRRVVVDVAGADSLKLRATNPASGEICVGRVRF